MAENFSDEGLDRILSFVPLGATSTDQTLFIAALTTSGAYNGTGTTALDGSTVPTRTTIWATGYSIRGGEPSTATGGYARKSMAAAVWGAAATNGQGRRSTASQQSMATSTSSWQPFATIGGAVVTSSSAGAGIAYYYSNYSDNSEVDVNSAGIVLQLTPFWELDI